MRREDLFIAIGMVDDERLDRCEKNGNPSGVNDWEEPEMHKRFYWLKRIIFIAAVVVMTGMLMGSGIMALLSMNMEDDRIHALDGEIHEGEERPWQNWVTTFLHICRMDSKNRAYWVSLYLTELIGFPMYIDTISTKPRTPGYSSRTKLI